MGLLRRIFVLVFHFVVGLGRGNRRLLLLLHCDLAAQP
jgi:hypothetical protein